MRVRTVLFLSALLAAPLLAGPDSPFDAAVRLFRSPAPGDRDQGSRIAGRELRRVLRPLLVAMKDADPEVRRRARESILALVPNHDRGEPEVQHQHNLRVQLAQAAAWQGVQLQLRRGGVVLQQPGLKLVNPQGKVLQELLRKEAARNVKGQVAQKALGVVGTFTNTKDGKKAFKVKSVAKDSQAAKAGVVAGDLIIAINGRPVHAQADFHAAIDPRRGWSGAQLMLVRGGAMLILRAP